MIKMAQIKQNNELNGSTPELSGIKNKKTKKSTKTPLNLSPEINVIEFVICDKETDTLQGYYIRLIDNSFSYIKKGYTDKPSVFFETQQHPDLAIFDGTFASENLSFTEMVAPSTMWIRDIIWGVFEKNEDKILKFIQQNKSTADLEKLIEDSKQKLEKAKISQMFGVLKQNCKSFELKVFDKKSNVLSEYCFYFPIDKIEVKFIDSQLYHQFGKPLPISDGESDLYFSVQEIEFVDNNKVKEKDFYFNLIEEFLQNHFEYILNNIVKKEI